ncbi:MAG: transporter permease [Spirochaetes bacterium]|nr:MAG: transporter permease [Spirochaetota bacterium]
MAVAVSILAALALYLLSGRYPKPGFLSPFSLREDATARILLFSIRLPRALAALLVGAVLGGSGAVFQTLFGNPLVDAGFLGVSQGAAFGAAIALLAGMQQSYGILRSLLSFHPCLRR